MIEACLPGLRPSLVPGAVGHDGEQPRLELFAPPEPPESVEGPHKRFLNGVLGVCRPRDQYRGAMRDRAVAADEFTVGLMIAAARGFDQAFVADSGGRSRAAVVYLHRRSPRVRGADVAADTRSPMAISFPWRGD